MDKLSLEEVIGLSRTSKWQRQVHWDWGGGVGAGGYGHVLLLQPLLAVSTSVPLPEGELQGIRSVSPMAGRLMP